MSASVNTTEVLRYSCHTLSPLRPKCFFIHKTGLQRSGSLVLSTVAYHHDTRVFAVMVNRRADRKLFATGGR
uniref:Uncharacterized protein n=1 Tax=Peronospora matthiolae TaxID=2874970 RepID=A0AAV1TPH2_9STRA